MNKLTLRKKIVLVIFSPLILISIIGIWLGALLIILFRLMQFPVFILGGNRMGSFLAYVNEVLSVI